MDSEHYYTELAGSFCRGSLGLSRETSDQTAIAQGLELGLSLHKFKRSAELPRVRHVLGMLRSLNPCSLLDVGSGRGTFLWPLLSALPHLEVISIENDPIRYRDIEAVSSGGHDNLKALLGDIAGLELEDSGVDCVTILEVLEHLDNPAQAAREALRLTRGWVIASVPSKEDNNPGHIHLFTGDDLTKMFLKAGYVRVSVKYVLNHMILLGRKGS